MEDSIIDLNKDKLKVIKSVDEAVAVFVENNDIDSAINYLRSHKEDITDFSFKVFETYSKDDTTGIIQLGLIIEKLL